VEVKMEYYFSTPRMSNEGEGSRPTVAVTSKEIWDKQHKLDYYELGDSKYSALWKALKVPEVMAEASENYFQPQKPMTCDELKAYLEKQGLTHNADLDKCLDDFFELSE
jgi:hypothetical protein